MRGLGLALVARMSIVSDRSRRTVRRRTALKLVDIMATKKSVIGRVPLAEDLMAALALMAKKGR